MIRDWIHWLSAMNAEELVFLFGAMLLLDSPRYALGEIAMCVWDFTGSLFGYTRRDVDRGNFDYCPSVCVVLAGLNESETISATLQSLWGTYPRMEVIVVDDGSTDGMAAVARRFAKRHEGVMVLSKPKRGGKSSALNFALPYTEAEVIVTVDTDSHLDPSAIWEIVQPLKDPHVGAVSAVVRTRNPFTNLATWLQTYEYLHSTFLGRLFVSRLGILCIVSGALGAFRHSTLRQTMGWDVGPGEDGDLTLRIRKAGFKIAFAPYAQCYTNVPVRWKQLYNQRRRWDRAVVTFECRKHIDMAYFWSPNFKWSEMALLLDRWFFNIVCLYGFWIYLVWFFLNPREDMWKMLGSFYCFYVLFEFIQLLPVLYYSNRLKRDLLVCAVFPIMPVYQLFLKFASLVAVTEELLWRKSFDDNFVPPHVRETVWRW